MTARTLGATAASSSAAISAHGAEVGGSPRTELDPERNTILGW